jgi:hypothetical protein
MGLNPLSESTGNPIGRVCSAAMTAAAFSGCCRASLGDGLARLSPSHGENRGSSPLRGAPINSFSFRISPTFLQIQLRPHGTNVAMRRRTSQVRIPARRSNQVNSPKSSEAQTHHKLTNQNAPYWPVVGGTSSPSAVSRRASTRAGSGRLK